MTGKRIILGVTGSIAAYKSADLTSRLVERGAEVHVVMTKAAREFITPMTLATLSRNPVADDLWDAEKDWKPGHIELADEADLLLVAPATAHIIAQFAHGLAPDLLTCIYLATRAPVIVAPAMNGKMLEHPATQANLDILTRRGNRILPTAAGMLACGYEGQGKLLGVEEILRAVAECFESRFEKGVTS